MKNPFSAVKIFPRRGLQAGALLIALGILSWAWLKPENIPAYTVQRGPLTQTIVATGKVRAPQRIDIGSQISAQVRELPVAEGATVDAGTILLRLEDSELKAALDQAKAAETQAAVRLRQIRELALPLARQNLLQAEANRDQAKRQLERNRALFGKGFIGQAQLDESQRAYAVAQAQADSAQLQVGSNSAGGADFLLAESTLQQAKASLALARSRLSYATVRAPVAGQLITRNIEAGDMAQPGKALLVLSPAGETQVVVLIDERNLNLLAAGQKAEISADAFPNQRFAGELVFINPAVDALRGSVEARLRIPQPPDYLRQDMTVSVNLLVAQRADTLTLPADALRNGSEGQPWVLVVREGRTQRQEVKLGTRGEGLVEIIDGLAAGEWVIPANQGKVRVDQRVQPQAISHHNGIQGK